MAGERYDPAIPIRRQGAGYAVEGRGYYLWDDDLEALLLAAREIERGNVGSAAIKRMLIIGPNRELPGESGGSSD